MESCACGCGKPVTPRKDGKKQQYRKGHSGVGERISAKCARCGIGITVQRWRLQKFGHVFCSRECSAKAHDTRVSSTCETCGTHILFKRTQPRRFCSYACWLASGEHLQPRPGQRKRITVSCSNCRVQIEVHLSKLETNGRFYCSIECRANHIIGPNNPAFTSGSGRKIEYGFNWRRQRRKALQRDGYTCRHCDAQPRQPWHLHVHHIVPASRFAGNWQEANVLTNLLTLCLSCHKIAERTAVRA